MDSAIRRICSAALAGLFTVSSRAPVRTILGSMVADADFVGGGALSARDADLSSAPIIPATGKDTGAASVRVTFPGWAYIRSGEESWLATLGAPEKCARCKVGMARAAASSAAPPITAIGSHGLFPDLKEWVRTDMCRLLSRERG